MLEWLEVAVLLQWHGFKCWQAKLQAEFWQLQVVAGAGKCGEPTRIVRGGHGCCQAAGKVEAVAGVGGGSQLLAVRG